MYKISDINILRAIQQKNNDVYYFKYWIYSNI